jgi:hypothetical protein
MKRSPTILLIAMLLLTACGGGASGKDARQATLTFLLNDVRTRTTSAAALEPASLGQTLQTGGQAQSGEDSRARLDLVPDGTIIRIGPNTLFTLEALGQDPANPSARLKLIMGQVWIILNGGSLEVETDYGSGAVRGSYMSVSFDQQHGMNVTCLEGHCSLANSAGTVELTGGQASRITSKGQPPTPPAPISEQELDDWQDASPESQEIIQPDTPPLPAPTAAPLKDGGKVNTAPLHFQISNNCTGQIGGQPVGPWTWEFERLADASGGAQTERITVATGDTVSGDLPAGQYIVTDWYTTGEQHGPQTINSDEVSLQVEACPADEGKSPSGAQAGSTGSSNALTSYTLINNCGQGTWHWRFEGPQTITVDIASGDTVSGQLPAGTYTAADWFDNGPSHTGGPIPPGGNITVKSCPDQ